MEALMLTRINVGILGISMFFASLPALLQLDCGTEARSTNRTAPLHTLSVNIADSSLSAGEEVAFVATLQAPNPCWHFHHFEISRDQHEKEIRVTAYGEYDGNPCQQVLGSVSASDSMTFAEPGTYTLKFWQLAEETLDKKIVVR
jgi:hypothetical protein